VEEAGPPRQDGAAACGLTGDIEARPIRHHSDKVLSGLEAQAVALSRLRKISEHRGQEQEEGEEDGKAKSQTSARRAVLNGAGATSRLRHRACRVSETFAHTRACLGGTIAHSRDTSIPAVYGLAESARSHDGAVTSATSAEMPAPITTPTITTTVITAPTKHPRAATATITSKSSRVSLQLTHELGGYSGCARAHPLRTRRTSPTPRSSG
jgi:hypothetical protein